MTAQTILPATFVGLGGTVQGQAAETGWQVTAHRTLCGHTLVPAARVYIRPGHATGTDPVPPLWMLRGTNSHARYSERSEVDALASRRALLGRPEATCAALIPVRKSPAWWALAQDERRRVMEAESHHIAHSMAYLPAIARRLYHCRDLCEPFDFLTWFEFAPADTARFDDLVGTLRGTPEWSYVEAETDIRLARA